MYLKFDKIYSNINMLPFFYHSKIYVYLFLCMVNYKINKNVLRELLKCMKMICWTIKHTHPQKKKEIN